MPLWVERLSISDLSTCTNPRSANLWSVVGSDELEAANGIDGSSDGVFRAWTGIADDDVGRALALEELQVG